MVQITIRDIISLGLFALPNVISRGFSLEDTLRYGLLTILMSILTYIFTSNSMHYFLVTNSIVGASYDSDAVPFSNLYVTVLLFLLRNTSLKWSGEQWIKDLIPPVVTFSLIQHFVKNLDETRVRTISSLALILLVRIINLFESSLAKITRRIAPVKNLKYVLVLSEVLLGSAILETWTDEPLKALGKWLRKQPIDDININVVVGIGLWVGSILRASFQTWFDKQVKFVSGEKPPLGLYRVYPFIMEFILYITLLVGLINAASDAAQDLNLTSTSDWQDHAEQWKRLITSRSFAITIISAFLQITSQYYIPIRFDDGFEDERLQTLAEWTPGARLGNMVLIVLIILTIYQIRTSIIPLIIRYLDSIIGKGIVGGVLGTFTAFNLRHLLTSNWKLLNHFLNI